MPNNEQEPRRKVVRIRFNFSWFYILLILAIGWMLFSQNGTQPAKIEWAEVQSIFRQGDIKEIHFVRNDYKGTITIKPERLAKYADKYPGGQVPARSPHLTFLVSARFDAEKEFGELNASLPEDQQVKIIMENDSRAWADILEWIIFPLLLILMWVFMFRGMSRNMGGGGAGGGGIFNVGKSTGKLAEKGTNNVTFKDVAGLYGAKEEVMEIVDFLKNPRKYTALGGKIPKGALLVGPPGTGKTLLAKAVAGEANVPFFSISGSDFVEMFVGVGASRVRDLFKQAKERQGARLAPMMEKGQCSPDDLRTLTLVDIAGDQARANASTEELMHAFDRLIGAASAKKKMENLLNQIKLNRRRAELTHVPFQNLSICFAFIGHPDTGQKEFRQAMTRVLSDIGLIEKDAVKTWQASQLLTTLTQNGAERRLIDEMLAQHGKTIYIIDANPSEWKEVEEQLPVLSEFINDRFVFDDYTPSELARLFIDYLHQQNMHLADDAQETLVGYFGSHAEGGRSEMKLLFNEVIFRQNTRLASAADISDEALVTIAKEDIPTD